MFGGNYRRGINKFRQQRRRKAILILQMLRTIVFAAITIVFSCAGVAAQEAPQVSLRDLNGRRVRLSAYRGKVVLINFWATWCPPCRASIPKVVELYNKYHAKGFEVIGISLDQEKADLLAFTKEKGMAWPQYFDGKGWDNEISSSLGITSIPAMFLVDKEGKFVHSDGSGLDAQIAKLLK